MSPRHARPAVRQLLARSGPPTSCRVVACRCGWTAIVAGWRAALAAGDQHWSDQHRAAGRRSP